MFSARQTSAAALSRLTSVSRSVFAWIGLAYVALRLWSFWDVFGRKPAVYPDSADYLHVASLSVWSTDFYTWWKPWGVPLLYKLLPVDPADGAPTAQWLLSVSSWLVLALVFSRELRTPALRVIGFAVVLAFSATPLVAQWDGSLLTESVAISLAALLTACLLRAVREPRRATVATTLAVAFALVATRDTNAYLMAMLLLPLAALLSLRGHRRIAVALAVTTVGVVSLSLWTYNVRRWETPMTDVVLAGVLPNGEMRAYFVRRGMPVRPGLWTALVESRTPPSSFEQDPRLDFFRPWFDRRARRTYLGRLVTHPRASVWAPVRNLPQMLSPETALPVGLDFFRPAGFRRPMPGWLDAVLYPQGGWRVFAWICLASAAAAVLAFWRLGRRSWIVPGLLAVSTVPHALVVWDGDPTSVDRHAVLLAVLARLSLWLFVLMTLDGWLAARASDR